jgi:hypothetical protein
LYEAVSEKLVVNAYGVYCALNSTNAHGDFLLIERLINVVRTGRRENPATAQVAQKLVVSIS